MPSPAYQLPDAQRDRLQGLLPANGQPGGQRKGHRVMIDGGRWRNVPARFGPWQAAYGRFRNGARRGLWGRALRHLQAREMNGVHQLLPHVAAIVQTIDEWA